MAIRKIYKLPSVTRASESKEPSNSEERVTQVAYRTRYTAFLRKYPLMDFVLRYKRVFLIILSVVLLVGGLYYTRQAFTPKAGTDAAASKEIADLVAQVGKLILLPEGEIPTAATVSDPDKLKSQLFFAKARVGDKVLIYTIAKKAYLYNPTDNKLVEVAPITLDAPAPTH